MQQLGLADESILCETSCALRPKTSQFVEFMFTFCYIKSFFFNLLSEIVTGCFASLSYQHLNMQSIAQPLSWFRSLINNLRKHETFRGDKNGLHPMTRYLQTRQIKLSSFTPRLEFHPIIANYNYT